MENKKKFKFTCSICADVWKGFLMYFTTSKYFFTEDFKTKNYYKHFLYSIGINTLLILSLFFITNLAGTGIFFQLFLGGFLAYSYNFVREWWIASRYVDKDGLGDPKLFSFEDIIFGSYGGIVGSVIAIVIYNIIN